MHKDWQDLIPFYAAGTLPGLSAAALEQHLIECTACRRALEEWHLIAGVVRAEAETWSMDLPALSPQVRRSSV